MSASLKGKTILITRRREQSGELQEGLESLGAKVIFFPTIQVIPPPEWVACDRALRNLAAYDLIVFASVNAVTFFLHRCVALGIPPETLSRCDLAVVGRRTGAELERLKLSPQHLPEEYTAASLLEHFARIVVEGKRILIPRGNLGREELIAGLRRLGATVDPVIVYHTVPADLSGAGDLMLGLASGSIDVVTFASPSAVNNFAGILPDDDLRTLATQSHIAAIGPTTADAIRSLGAEPDVVAKDPSARGLTEAIASFFRERS
ncbi:MAG: uroporphyrinogen-III synthase [Bacteroidota bacterium]